MREPRTQKIKLKSPLECEIKYFLKCVNNKNTPKTKALGTIKSEGLKDMLSNL